MPKKRLIILANSVKHDARCLAGREIVHDGEQYTFGAWIRPVSLHGQGELDGPENTCADGAPIAIFDFVEVDLLRPVHNPFQPENWTITGPGCWHSLKGQYERPPLEYLTESPADLWFDRQEKRTDRISHLRLQNGPPAQSLYLIHPQKLRLKFFTEFNSFKNREAHRGRALFSYNGADYDFSLTDPLAHARYCPVFPNVMQPPKVVPLSPQQAPLICVSLAGDFSGYHYKVVATIIQ